LKNDFKYNTCQIANPIPKINENVPNQEIRAKVESLVSLKRDSLCLK